MAPPDLVKPSLLHISQLLFDFICRFSFCRVTSKARMQLNSQQIPAGWTILLVTPALHLTSDTFKDHLEFNPWRWKDLDSLVISKNFMPFGGGLRQCAGAEYTRAFLSTFLHVLVTKYRWTTVKGARISRSPMLAFGDGAHIKFSEKKNN
ncbi:hypothetical protein ACFX2J_035018 [Malus domestica]